MPPGKPLPVSSRERLPSRISVLAKTAGGNHTGFDCKCPFPDVIASEAKQSRFRHSRQIRDCRVVRPCLWQAGRTPRNDDGSTSPAFVPCALVVYNSPRESAYANTLIRAEDARGTGGSETRPYGTACTRRAGREPPLHGATRYVSATRSNKRLACTLYRVKSTWNPRGQCYDDS